MHIASKPRYVDDPGQQLTTGSKVGECLLKANPSVLMAHANNSQQERNCGNAFNKKPKNVVGQRQQLTA